MRKFIEINEYNVFADGQTECIDIQADDFILIQVEDSDLPFVSGNCSILINAGLDGEERIIVNGSLLLENIDKQKNQFVVFNDRLSQYDPLNIRDIKIKFICR